MSDKPLSERMHEWARGILPGDSERTTVQMWESEVALLESTNARLVAAARHVADELEGRGLLTEGDYMERAYYGQLVGVLRDPTQLIGNTGLKADDPTHRGEK